MPEEFRPKPRVELPPYDPTRPQFRILDHVRPTSKRGGNYWARCPSCADHGRDRSGDNLAISVSDPRKYKCWAGMHQGDDPRGFGTPDSSQEAG